MFSRPIIYWPDVSTIGDESCRLRAALTNMPGIGYAGASGLPGYNDINSIQAPKIRDNVYSTESGTSAADTGNGLMAPRVEFTDHQQANQILRILH